MAMAFIKPAMDNIYGLDTVIRFCLEQPMRGVSEDLSTQNMEAVGGFCYLNMYEWFIKELDVHEELPLAKYQRRTRPGKYLFLRGTMYLPNVIDNGASFRPLSMFILIRGCRA